MKGINSTVLTRPGFWIGLCLLFLVVFCWPFLTVPNLEFLGFVYLYLFVSWGILIGLLFLVSRRLGNTDGAPPHV